METTVSKTTSNQMEDVIQNEGFQSPFIEANTDKADLHKIAENHIIPVFIKDNQPLISQPEFIDRTIGIARER